MKICPLIVISVFLLVSIASAESVRERHNAGGASSGGICDGYGRGMVFKATSTYILTNVSVIMLDQTNPGPNCGFIIAVHSNVSGSVLNQNITSKLSIPHASVNASRNVTINFTTHNSNQPTIQSGEWYTIYINSTCGDCGAGGNYKWQRGNNAYANGYTGYYTEAASTWSVESGYDYSFYILGNDTVTNGTNISRVLINNTECNHTSCDYTDVFAFDTIPAQQVVLRARLVTESGEADDNDMAPLYGPKNLSFTIDGTTLGYNTTNTSGWAIFWYKSYTLASGTNTTINVAFAGDVNYSATSNTSQNATVYHWSDAVQLNSTTAPKIPRPRGMTAGDFDGDGKTDIAMTSARGTLIDEVIIYFQEAYNLWTQTNLTNRSNTLKGDYYCDVMAFGNGTDTNLILQEYNSAGNGVGRLMYAYNLSADRSTWTVVIINSSFGAGNGRGSPHGLAVGDVDGDGYNDTVVWDENYQTGANGDQYGNMTIYYWDGATPTGWTMNMVCEDWPVASAGYIADLDLDGDMDIVGGGDSNSSGSPDLGRVIWAEQTSSRTFTCHNITTTAIGRSYNADGRGDWNGDFYNDIVAGSVEDKFVRIWYGPTFASNITLAYDGNDIQWVEMRDMGLNQTFVFASSYNSGDVYMFWNDSTGVQNESILNGATCPTTHHVVLYDLDNDDDLDVMFSCNGADAGGKAWVVYNNGSINGSALGEKGEAPPSDFHDIGACMIMSNESDYYQLTANIDNHGVPCMNITASNVVLDCNGYYIDGTDTGVPMYTGIYVPSGIENITIANCTISDFRYGILTNSNATIYNISGSSNNHTIYINNTNNCSVSNITSANADYYDLFATGGDLIRVRNSTFTSGGFGVVFQSNVNYGIIEDNTISSDTVGLYLNAVSNIRVNNNTITGGASAAGMKMDVAHTCNISNNTITGPSWGFWLEDSRNGRIIKNQFSSAAKAVFIQKTGQNNRLLNNTITSTGGTGRGISVEHQSGESPLNLHIGTNLITSNYRGIYIEFHSDNNTVSNNTIISTNRGITLDTSWNNTITNNSIKTTNSNGIDCNGTANNTFWNNSIVVTTTGDGMYFDDSENETVENVSIMAADNAIGFYDASTNISLSGVNSTIGIVYTDDGGTNTYYIYNSTFSQLDGADCSEGGGCNAETFYVYNTTKYGGNQINFTNLSYSDKVRLYYYHRVNVTTSDDTEITGANVTIFQIQDQCGGVVTWNAWINYTNLTTTATGYTDYAPLMYKNYTDNDDAGMYVNGCPPGIGNSIDSRDYFHYKIVATYNGLLGISDSFSKSGLYNYTNITIYNATFVEPTPDNTTQLNQSWIFVNVSTSPSSDYGWFGDFAYLEWNETTNYTMEVENATLFSLNFSVIGWNGTSTYRVWVRNNISANMWGATLSNTITMNYTGLDTYAPYVWGCTPETGTSYSNTLKGTNVTLQCFANERANLSVSTSSTVFDTDDLFNWNNQIPYYTFRTNITLCNSGSSSCSSTYYISANDTSNNEANATVNLTLSVSGSGGGGGGGGGGESALFHIEPLNCWDPIERKNIVCPYESYGAGQKTYQICSDSDGDITVTISFEGYAVDIFETASLMSATNESIPVGPGDCVSVVITNTYPENGSGTFSNTDSHPFNIVFTATGAEEKVPITIFPPGAFFDPNAVLWEGELGPLGYVTITTGHALVGFFALIGAIILVRIARKPSRRK